MAKTDIWMPIYIGDYLRDTAALSAEEHGAYLLLLMHYWQKGGEIGHDIERLSRVAHTNVATCRFLLETYFVLEGENYKNKRADKELGAAENRRIASSENGKKGGRPPKNNLEKTYSFNLGIPRSNLQKSSSSSSSPSSLQSPAPTKKTADKPPLPPEASALASLLFMLHVEKIDKGKRRPSDRILKSWAEDIDKLNRLDGRPWADIEKVIRWVKVKGQFWSSNIMSGSKLREKFDTLYAQMIDPGRGGSKAPKVTERTAFLDMEEK